MTMIMLICYMHDGYDPNEGYDDNNDDENEKKIVITIG